MGNQVDEPVVFIHLPDELFHCCWWLDHLNSICLDQAGFLAITAQTEINNKETRAFPFCLDHAKLIREMYRENKQKIFHFETVSVLDFFSWT